MGGGKKKNAANRQQTQNNAKSTVEGEHNAVKPEAPPPQQVPVVNSKDNRDPKPAQPDTEATAHSSGSMRHLTNGLADLFNASVDCLALHLILAMNNANVTSEMKEVLKSVVDLKITNDVAHKAEGSQRAVYQQGNGEEGAEQPPKSKEEVLAERKAKAAEAKARKAAAAAAKKAAKAAVNEDGARRERSDAKHKDQRHGSKQHETSRSPHKTNPTGEAKGTKHLKSALSTGASSYRPSQPFRRVCFDTRPSEDTRPNARRRQPSLTEVSTANVHPAFLNFAARCEAREVVGIDAVCVAFIRAFTQFFRDYKMTENTNMSYDLDQAIRPHLSYLTQNGTQPFPLALGNLIRLLKKEITELPADISESEGKRRVEERLEGLWSGNFEVAFEEIRTLCFEKIKSTGCVLTYSWCPVVEDVLLYAQGKIDLHVCVVDSPVDPRGRRLVKALCARMDQRRAEDDEERVGETQCTYAMLSGIGYCIKQCGMVLLGCSAIFSNGSVVAERGAAQVALVAAAANIPVLVAAQTYKFVDRVQTFDETDRSMSALMGDRQEIIPADLVTAVVTDIRILPPSSAPALLKAKKLDVG